MGGEGLKAQRGAARQSGVVRSVASRSAGLHVFLLWHDDPGSDVEKDLWAGQQERCNEQNSQESRIPVEVLSKTAEHTGNHLVVGGTGECLVVHTSNGRCV